MVFFCDCKFLLSNQVFNHKSGGAEGMSITYLSSLKLAFIMAGYCFRNP